jgi:hypothetical protein
MELLQAGFTVVAIDSHIGTDSRPILNFKVPLAGLVGLAAALLALGIMALDGFHDSGLRLASEAAWRFASFVFFAAAIGGPLCRLIPMEICKQLGALRRQLIWSFCASYLVFLATLILPNTVGGVTHEDATAGMTLFSLFGGLTCGVMAYTASSEAAVLLGERARRALLSVSGSFFWLTYALMGLAHLSGPHRPDGFYGLSLSLMILALLLRFADRFVATFRGTQAVPALGS